MPFILCASLSSLCVRGQVHHPCLQELQLSLFGPGPAPYRSPGNGFALGERMPQNMSRGEESVLFVGGTGKGSAHSAWACSSAGRGDTDPSRVLSWCLRFV
jgi:hypothetical protein